MTNIYKSTNNLKKCIKIMYRMFILLIVTINLCNATSVYSQKEMLSLDLQNKTIKEVFAAIEKNSEFVFFYKSADIDDKWKVSIKVENKTISQILTQLFENTDYICMISDRQIFISKRERTEHESVVIEVEQQPGIPISGTVNDENGPIPGVNVIIKGTTQGIATDVDGRFSINVPDRNAVLVFSFIGYATQEIVVGDRIRFDVTLVESVGTIDEVVVVAYGAQKKLTVTGAISTVQTKELKQSSAANLSVALAGRLPGLTALQSSGMPGNDAVNLYLRGMGTINGANPLILIDGVPRENLNLLDPNEVASISILKDASSTAVFGVRGANGVILVTTRQGDTGKPQLSVTSEFGLQSLSARFDRIHSWEFAELRNQAARNDGVSEENLPFTPYMIQKYRDGSDPVFFPDRDIYHDFFRDYAPQTRINLNYSGASDKIKYFVNAGFINQQGLVRTESPRELGYDPSFKMNRYSFRTNMEYKIFDNLKISANVASYMEQMNRSYIYIDGTDVNFAVQMLMQYLMPTPPTRPGPVTVPGYDVPENYIVEYDINQPTYGALNRWGYVTRNTTQFNSSAGLDWGLDFITPGLSTKIMIAYDGNYLTELTGIGSFQIYGYDVARTKYETSSYTVLRGPDQTDESLNLGKRNNSMFYMNIQYALNYVRQFGKHNVTGMYLLQRDNWENYGADLPYNILGMAGRATYNYDQRYMAEFNVGYNGSEQFHKDHRFGFFPAFSAGWVVTNENFLKDNDLLTHLKLRASYGKVGNDKLGNERFLYRTVVSEVWGYYSQLGLNRRIEQGKIGNELLSWEIAEKTNYGVDIQLFRELSLSFDLFREQRDNVLITRGMVPVLQGVPISNLPKLNMGRIHNKGYETEATWQKRMSNGLAITVKGNFAYNRNKMVYMDEPILPDDYARRYRRTGYSIGQSFGYKIDFSNGNGYLNTPEELAWAKEAYNIGVPRLGDIKYSDENGDGVIDTKDQVPIGYPNIPRITYGFSGSVAFKGVDFSFLFTGIAQSSKSMDFGFTELTFYDGFFNDIHRRAWTEERYLNGENITFPALSMSRGTNHLSNELTIADRSFLRLKNVELGYNLPGRWLQSMNISRTRVYMSGANLWTWMKMPIKTVDPEQSAGLSIPIMKMVNFGLNIEF